MVGRIQAPRLWLALCLAMLFYAGAVLLDFGVGVQSLFANWDAVPEVMRARIPGYAGIAVVFSLLVLGLTYATNLDKHRATWSEFCFIFGTALASFWMLTIRLLTAADYDAAVPVGSVSIAWVLTVLGFLVAIAAAVVMRLDSRKRKRAAEKRRSSEQSSGQESEAL